MDLIQTIKDIYELAKKAKNVDIQQKTMDLREEIQSLREKNVALSEENQQLKAKISVQKELDYDGMVYWCNKDGSRDGPFCQVCYDKEGKLVRLHDNKDNHQGYPWRCMVCDKVFKAKGYSPDFIIGNSEIPDEDSQ